MCQLREEQLTEHKMCISLNFVCRLKACPVSTLAIRRQLLKTFSATVAVFGDSVDRALDGVVYKSYWAVSNLARPT